MSVRIGSGSGVAAANEVGRPNGDGLGTVNPVMFEQPLIHFEVRLEPVRVELSRISAIWLAPKDRVKQPTGVRPLTPSLELAISKTVVIIIDGTVRQNGSAIRVSTGDHLGLEISLLAETLAVVVVLTGLVVLVAKHYSEQQVTVEMVLLLLVFVKVSY